MRSLFVAFTATLVMFAPAWSAAQESGRPAVSAGTGNGTGAGAGTGSASSGSGPATSTVTTASGSTYTMSMREQEKPAAKPRTDVDDLRRKIEADALGRWVRTLTNVQVELTISDQNGAETPAKKTVSMVVSSGSWGKIRSAQAMEIRAGVPGDVVDLNVDARPFVSTEGPIQLELTVVYSPPAAQAGGVMRLRPTGVNQSLTVILQSGKPLVISQAADPIGDRKIIIEAKATVLK